MLTACLQLEICTCRYTGKRWLLSSKSWISIHITRCLMSIFVWVFINEWSYICAYFYGWLFSMCSCYLDFAVSGQIVNYWRMLTTCLMQTPSTWTPSSSGFCSATIITWKLHRMSAFSPLVSTKLEATCPVLSFGDQTWVWNLESHYHKLY